MQFRDRGRLVLALFFCSGATALIYEVVWSKFLSQMFGSTIYAQTVVMAAFMGGLALGNQIFGAWADRAERPVRAYGLLEMGIGIYAFLFMPLDLAADRIFVVLGRHWIGHSLVLLSLKGVLSVAILLGPTILMGGTLPLLAAWLQSSSEDAGRRSARFYSVNSLGAVAGAAMAGFWLVQDYGLMATLWLTATANLLVGSLAFALGAPLNRQQAVATDAGPAAGPKASDSEKLHWAGVIVALTGAVSMGLEVLSSRSLALIFGSSLQTFAVVLIAFILGIGLGSAWIASTGRSGTSIERLVVLLLCLAAGWVTLLVFNIERWVDFYRLAGTGLARNATGYFYYELMTTGIAVVIIGIPAALIGAVLPLMIRSAGATLGELGSKVGALLTWNTLGAVVGTLLTGFVLMPHAGLRNAFMILALVLAFSASLVALRRFWIIGALGASAVCLFAISGLLFGAQDWRNVMSSGSFRLRETKFDPRLMQLRKDHIKVIFYDDGPDATVSVEKVDGVAAPASLGLRINGKPDAGTAADLSTQFLLAHLPMLARPGAKDVFVLGLGSGITAGAVLDYPIEHLDIAENCEPVVRAARLFDDWNHHVLDQPQTEVWHEDARTVLKLRPKQYDVIITEPSNPWQAGIGSVFSREFYEIAASRLKPGGVVAQWFHLYEMQDDVLELVLRAFRSAFPFMEIWDDGEGDIILLGSKQEWATGTEAFRKGFANEAVRKDMWMIDIQSPEALIARQISSQRTGFAIAGDGPIQSDLHPILEYVAPRAFYIGTQSRMLERYDERTRQQLLAPPEKTLALRSLPLAKAQVIFSSFSTVNGELYGCVFGSSLGTDVPCALPTPNPAPPPGSGGGAAAEASKAFASGDLERADAIANAGVQLNPHDSMAEFVLRVIERQKQLRDEANKTVASR